jgi:hypothetical protein
MVGALLAGCGGSDSEGGGDDFVTRVDAVCKEANPELTGVNAALIRARDEARAGRAEPRQTFAAFATLLRRASAVTDRVEARLRAIVPPAPEREFHAALLDSLGQGSSNLREQIAAAERRDAAALRDLSRKGALLNERTKGLVTGHGGFRFCGRA